MKIGTQAVGCRQCSCLYWGGARRENGTSLHDSNGVSWPDLKLLLI
jgi:hypothetical protein